MDRCERKVDTAVQLVILLAAIGFIVVMGTICYAGGDSSLALASSIERSEPRSTSFHMNLNMRIERSASLPVAGQAMRKTAVSVRL